MILGLAMWRLNTQGAWVTAAAVSLAPLAAATPVRAFEPSSPAIFQGSLPGASSTVSGAASLLGVRLPDPPKLSSTLAGDFSYWSQPGASDGAPPAAARLDRFAASDAIANLPAAVAPARPILSASGVISIMAQADGLNAVALTVPEGTAITGIEFEVAPGVEPTGLVVTLAGGEIDFSGLDYSLGPLTPDDVVIDFPAAPAATLASFLFDARQFIPLARIDMRSTELGQALFDYDDLANGVFALLGFAFAR